MLDNQSSLKAKLRRRVSIGAGLLASFALGFFVQNWLSMRTVAESSLAPHGIGIPEFVEEVRRELISSDMQRLANKEAALFEAKSVDLEISFVVKRTTDAGSKVTLEVVDLDAKSNLSAEKTQKMTLHLDIRQPLQENIPPIQRLK